MTSTNKGIKYQDDYRNILANYDVKKNITNPRITRYEKSEIMGQRLTHIANGAIPMIKIDPTEQLSVKEIVAREYKEGKIPYIIERHVGDNHTEYWKFADLVRD